MREILYREAIQEALSEEMTRDETVFMIGEDIGKKGGVYQATAGLHEKFEKACRIYDTPISEQAIIGAALGAALMGFKPVAEIMYIDFTTLAMDQIVNQCAKLHFATGGQAVVPVVIRTQGGVGRGIGVHHCQSLEAWYVHIPGLKVVMPATPYDVKGLLKASIRNMNPVMFIEHKLLYTTKGEVPEEEYLVPLGKAQVKREGTDVTIVTWSRMVLESLEAAESLEKEGISAEVVDLRTLKPLDVESIISSVKKTGRAVVVHEAVKMGGFGGEIAAIIMEKAFDYLDAPVKRIAGLDTNIPYARHLESTVIPNKEWIIEGVRQLF